MATVIDFPGKGAPPQRNDRALVDLLNDLLREAQRERQLRKMPGPYYGRLLRLAKALDLPLEGSEPDELPLSDRELAQGILYDVFAAYARLEGLKMKTADGSPDHSELDRASASLQAARLALSRIAEAKPG